MIADKDEILKRFQCQNSGNCCRHAGVVYVTKDEISSMAALCQMPEFLFRQNYVTRHNGWEVVAHERFRPDCFLDCQNRCTVYESRPKACRTFPDWPAIWDSEESLKKEALLCPGLAKAISDFFGV